MAIVNTKSTIVSNLDAGVNTQSYYNGGVKRSAVATVEKAASDSNGSVFRFFRVPSHARIDYLGIASDVITGFTALEVGVFEAGASSPTVTQLFASAVDLSAGKTMTDITYESAATDISKIEQRLWERIGLSEDPKCMYDVCGYGTTVGTYAGTISMKIEWVE